MVNRDDRQEDRPGRANDPRSPFQRDRDRILYTSALRRLAGVTQVVSPTEGQLIHNRLTHTFEVAQIAKGFAEYLLQDPEQAEAAKAAGGLDVAVVEAAALAHDLGHPPFGHIAEEALNSALLKAGRDPKNGFEGNAQSFRIVTKLSARHSLNLTRATLCAILKYPWTRADSAPGFKKWGVYTSESDVFHWAREMVPSGFKKKTLEAKIMDWADDVAYAVHDMEDFFRAGLIPLDRLVTDSEERGRFLDAELHRQGLFGSTADDLYTVFTELMQVGPISSPYRGTQRDRAALRGFTSDLINRYITAASLDGSAYGEDALIIEEFAENEVAMLKGLTWFYVINSQALAAQRLGQKSLIMYLFSAFSHAASSSKKEAWNIFPEYHREILLSGTTSAQQVRMVADVIAGMSEAQVVGMYQRLSGESLGSAMDQIFP